MHGLTGTWRLIRLGLRVDRIKLPVVILAISAMFFITSSSVIDIYGDDPEQQLSYAATSAPSVVGRVFAGPIHGPDLGSIVMNETFLFTALAVAFMSTLTVIRHTRQNEETNRTELIGSTIVSKHAPLVAALVVAVIANVAIFSLASLILIITGLPVQGSLLAGLSLAAIGITFAGIAGIAAQLTDSSRGANALCALVIGVAFILRAAGDSLGDVVNNGLGVSSALPSWFSPIGWGQQMYPFTEQNIWIFGLFIALTAFSVITAVLLMNKRDIGLGLFATKPGRARAKQSLQSTYGLARKLQKNILIGWSIAIVVFGITYGLVINEFQGFLEENEEIREAFSQIGDNLNFAFLSVLIAFMGITISGYAAHSLLRMRGEEAGGQVESILSTKVGRLKWMFSHIIFVLFGVILLLTLATLSMGLTYVFTTGADFNEFWSIAGGLFAQVFPILAFSGFVIALYSFMPNIVAPLAWASFAFSIVILQLGLALNLPQWIINLSPFGHLPSLPSEGFELPPVLGLSFVAIILIVFGFWKFKNRDIKV